MAKLAHTPGPWKLYQFGGPQIGNADTGEAVCTMWGNERSAHANARLIAAAPDLLAAVLALAPIADAYVKDFSAGLSPTGRETLESRIKEARAAIAKAEGA